MTRAELILKPGHIRPIWAGHPWIYTQGLPKDHRQLEDGAEVVVRDPKGQPLGVGFYCADSAIGVRLFTRDIREHFDDAFVRKTIQAAINLRLEMGLPCPETNAYRLIHAEGDRMPGLIVDRFDDTLAVQWNIPAMRQRADVVEPILMELTGATRIVDRTPKEGDAAVALAFKERGFRFELPPELNQKTGYYFDQRPLRNLIESLAQDRDVFDGHSFVGGMSLAAARGGARSVTTVDSSGLAISVAQDLMKRHGYEDRVSPVRADVKKYLAEEEQASRYDLVLLDPPPYAPKRGKKNAANEGYAKLVELGTRAARPGALLVLSSCSAAVSMVDLERAIATGATRAGHYATVVERLYQGADHPVPAAFPEALYLRTVVARLSKG